MIIDEGNGGDLEFGHTDYETGEGRFVTRSENDKERYINPELSVEERKRISTRDTLRRNQYAISLWCENNTEVRGFVMYNHATESLSFRWSVAGYNGKKLFDITRGVNK